MAGTTTGLFKVPDPAKDWIGLTRRDRAFALWNTATWDSDLRRYVDKIADIQSGGLGSGSTGECQFIEYTDLTTDNITIRYRAYHRQPPARDFLLRYNISVKRGISGTTVASYSSTTPALSPATLVKTIADLLRPIGTKGPYTRCSFAIELHTYPRTRNGFGYIRDYEDHDTSAFALMAK